MAQEGRQPELPVILRHLHKAIALRPVVEEVAESHHLGLCTEGSRGIHDGRVERAGWTSGGAAVVMATATAFTASVMNVRWPTSSLAKTDLLLFLDASWAAVLARGGAAALAPIPGEAGVSSSSSTTVSES